MNVGPRPALEWVVRAARAAVGVDGVVIATTDKSPDDAVAAMGERLGVHTTRGPSEDVLRRFAQVLDEHPADAVVRLTADCPLLDPRLIGQIVAAWRHDTSWDYVATTLVRTLPRGLDVELVTATALRELDRTATGVHRVHVTSLLYTQPHARRLLGLVVAPPADDLRVTLDTPEDYAALEEVVRGLGDQPPAWQDVVAFLRSRPDVRSLNAAIEQKPLEAG